MQNTVVTVVITVSALCLRMLQPRHDYVPAVQHVVQVGAEENYQINSNASTRSSGGRGVLSG
jgi:hypothetical protein